MKNIFVNLKKLVPKFFLHAYLKPSDIFRIGHNNKITLLLKNPENAKSFIYTLTESIYLHIPSKTPEQRQIREEILKFFIYDYLQQYIEEEKILIIQSELIKEWKLSNKQ